MAEKSLAVNPIAGTGWGVTGIKTAAMTGLSPGPVAETMLGPIPSWATAAKVL